MSLCEATLIACKISCPSFTRQQCLNSPNERKKSSIRWSDRIVIRKFSFPLPKCSNTAWTPIAICDKATSALRGKPALSSSSMFPVNVLSPTITWYFVFNLFAFCCLSNFGDRQAGSAKPHKRRVSPLSLQVSLMRLIGLVSWFVNGEAEIVCGLLWCLCF